MITQGSGGVLASLLRGSVVLTGRVCRCLPRLAALGPRVWAYACLDGKATDERQQRAYEAAVARAVKADKPEPTPEEIPRVTPSRRSPGDALGFLVAGSVVGFGVVGTVASVALPRLLAVVPDGIGPYVLGAAAVAWTGAALAVAPPLPADPEEEEVEEGQEDDVEDQAPEEQVPQADPREPLFWHVITALSDAEFTRRAGVHLDVLLSSAGAAGIVPADTEQARFRGWVEKGLGLPVTDSLGMRIEGKPVTRTGVRVDAVAGVLGMTPTALLEARTERGLQRSAEAPVQAPAEAPIPAQQEAPAAAFLTLIPGGLSATAPAPSQTPSPASPQEGAQEAR